VTTKVQLLDTTLRDGSYVVDFQLTSRDTALIAAALDSNNVPFIEVGHGVGMGASANPNTRAAASDEDYLRAASGAISKARWGMFFIPGIGREEDLELAATYGMSMVRIGTNVTEVAKSEPFIQKAKKLGMFVSANFMKTYAASPEQVGRYARQSMEYGADIVCVVDSAGGMFPEDVRAYFDGVRSQCDVPLGFHGHNNMGMAIANSLVAVELGAAIVDTSIRGMGRSAGNAATEILLLALRRRGIDLGIDPLRIMTVAEQRIDPMLRNYPQVDSIGIISGYAQFHSSFMGTINDYAQRYSVDPRELILHVTREDKVNAPAELVERIARTLSAQRRIPMRVQVTAERSNIATDPDDLVEATRAVTFEANVLAKKYGKLAVFNVVQCYRSPRRTRVSTSIMDGPEYVIASAEVADAQAAATIVDAADGGAPLLLLDCDLKTTHSRGIIESAIAHAKQSQVLHYSDLSAWARCVAALVARRGASDGRMLAVNVAGNNALANHIERELALIGSRDEGAQLDAVVACDDQTDPGLVERLRPDGFLVDALIGAVSERMSEVCRERGIPIYRPDMRAVIHSEAATAVGIATLVSRVQGIGVIDGISIAAGGMLAPLGTVIVDSINTPSRVYGVADGKGLLLPADGLTAELQRRLAHVEESVASTVG